MSRARHTNSYPDGGRGRRRGPPSPSGSGVFRSPSGPQLESSVYGGRGTALVPANTVNSPQNTVNSGLRKPAEVIGLQARIAQAASRLPAKELERDTGLPAREAEELATGLRLPRLPNLQKLTRRDPECLEAVVRFLAGDVGLGAMGPDPARAIAELIRRLSR